MPDAKAVAMRLRSIEADITTLALDAIVNAANEPLIRGGGVDGAIRRKAGDGMERELRAIGRCPTGEAVITKAHRLPAKFVIHTVAPVWSGGGPSQEDLLSRCYSNALARADEANISTIAFPCIGTGIYGWPSERAANIAFDTIVEHLGRCTMQTEVTFCCFSADDRARYQELIDLLAA